MSRTDLLAKHESFDLVRGFSSFAEVISPTILSCCREIPQAQFGRAGAGLAQGVTPGPGTGPPICRKSLYNNYLNTAPPPPPRSCPVLNHTVVLQSLASDSEGGGGCASFSCLVRVGKKNEGGQNPEVAQ